MKTKTLIKGLFATATLALSIIVTPASLVYAEETQGTYTVEKNDNLSKIAKKLTGNEKFWKDIYNANAGIIKDGYLIYAGQVLTIPAAVPSTPVTPAPAAPTPEVTIPSTPATPTSTPEATVPSTPATPTPTIPTPAPEATVPSTPVTPAPETTEYTLDYNAIAAWVDGGFLGIDESGSPVVMALNATNDYAIIIFADNSDMTAASFMGPITYTDTLATITDTANGMALTFGVAQISDDTLALDMGEIGMAAIQSASQKDILEVLKLAIDSYKHIA